MKSLSERQAQRYLRKCLALGVEELDLTNVDNLPGIGRINLEELPFDQSPTAIIPTSIRTVQAAAGAGIVADPTTRVTKAGNWDEATKGFGAPTAGRTLAIIGGV